MNIEITVIATLFGLFFGIAGYLSGKYKDIEQKSKQLTEIITKLDYQTKSIEEIKDDHRNTERIMSDFSRRLIITEQSLKQAHKRINESLGLRND